MPPRRPPRIPGFAYRGCYRYFLTFCTFNRSHVFVEHDVVTAVLQQMLRTSDEERFAIRAYCFMRDHVHLVVEGLDDRSDLRRWVKVAKQRAAYVCRKQFGVMCLWQEGYHERVLRSDETTGTVVRYVLNNPVRAGLVTRAEDYPFLGAQFWPEAI